jgi:flagellar basal body-associated protein FliL
VGQTRSDHDVLRSIEDELRQDHQIWQTIERQLHELHAPPAPSRETWIAWGTFVVLFAVATFGLGWTLGEQAQETAAPVVAEVTYQDEAFTQQREGGPFGAVAAPETFQLTYRVGLENPNARAADLPTAP